MGSSPCLLAVGFAHRVAGLYSSRGWARNFILQERALARLSLLAQV